MVKTKVLAAMAVFSVALLVTPGALAQAEDIWAKYEPQIAEINKEFGMPTQPELTDEQWEQYEAKVTPVYQKQDALYAQIEELNKEILEIEKEFGLNNDYPELTEEQWIQYSAKINEVYNQYDTEAHSYYLEHDTYYKEETEILQEYGIIDHTYHDAPEEFFVELDELYVKHQASIDVIGDHTMSAQDKAPHYSIIATQVNPAMASIHEKYGYQYPTLTEEQVISLDAKLSELNKKYDSKQLD